MHDEFDTVARWTADAALELGPDYAVPAGCRGSGGPASLNWLLATLRVTPGDLMLDCGAGVGGPAAFAAELTGLRPVLCDPEPSACDAAQRLFGLPATVASGQNLPFADSTFDVVWSVAVLCTVEQKEEMLAEIARVLRASGRLGLLVYVRTTDDLRGGPEGNAFPDEDELGELIVRAGFQVTGRCYLDDLPADGDDWTRRVEEVDRVLERDHADDQPWLRSQDQARAFGGLLDDGRVRGLLVALTKPGRPLAVTESREDEKAVRP